MRHQIDRRQFIARTSSYVALLVAGEFVFASSASAIVRQHFLNSPQADLLKKIPPLEGAIAFDQATIEKYSHDFGRNVQKAPLGVFFPKSRRDLETVANFCRENEIAFTARGIAGSAYGQALTQNGIVIDFSELNKMAWISSEILQVEAGAIWKDVLDFTIQRQRSPQVLPDTIVTSVGGLLSAGGIGETSFNLGSLADSVLELELLTMEGRWLVCSESKNRDVFLAALGGMGQIGIIYSVKLKLLATPRIVNTTQFRYDVIDEKITQDLEKLALSLPAGAIGGHIMIPKDQPAHYLMDVSWWEGEAPEVFRELRGKVQNTKSWSFYDYANRNTKGWIEGVAKGGLLKARPYMSFYLPQESAREMMETLMRNPEWARGSSRIYLAPLVRKNFHRPMFALPQADTIMHFRLYNVLASPVGSAEHKNALEINARHIVPKIFALRGTVYLPFSPILSANQLVQQFGRSLLQSFLALRNKHDPKGLLNRGAFTP